MGINIWQTVYSETNRTMLAGGIFLFLMASAAYALAQNEADSYRWALDSVKAGQLPAGWHVSASNPDGPLADWAVGMDSAASKPENILSIVHIHDTSTAVFNLNWTQQFIFHSGDMSVRLRANSGKEDQGGGMIWRVQDENNYYVARYNPLESNFRLYYVEDSQRNTLASAEHLTSKAGAWVYLKIRHQGQLIQGWFNNTLAWEVDDAHLPKAGGIGLWSKADAASSFADFEVHRVPLKTAGKVANE